MDDLTFLTSARQNSFFTEIAAAIAYELEALGVGTRVVDSVPADGRGGIVIIAPHEFAALEGWRTLAPVLPRAVVVCTEQPGTKWFKLSRRAASCAGAVFDINRASVRALSSSGVPAAFLQLGYSQFFDHRSGAPRDRDIVFLGSLTQRRELLLAEAAEDLAKWRTRLIFSSDQAPSTVESECWSMGSAKWALLGQSRVLLNIHRSATPYFEWLRVVEAASNGCAVVSEVSEDHEPFRHGENIVFAPAGSVVDAAHALLDDQLRRKTVAEQAEELVRSKPLRTAAEQIAARAQEASQRPSRSIRRVIAYDAGQKLGVIAQSVSEGLANEVHAANDVLRARSRSERAALKSLRLDNLELSRAMARVEMLASGERADPVTTASASHSDHNPTISVLISSYNHAAYLPRCLDSIEPAAADLAVEIVVVDDSSSDSTWAALCGWVQDHPDTSVLAIHAPTNRGLPRGRNLALEHARGEFTFTLDADNLLLTGGLSRLHAHLTSHPDAAFGFGYLQTFDVSGPTGIANAQVWNPEELARENYIDAMALIRTDRLREVGGYTVDPRLHGWEDYDLWLGFAERGWHGVLVPEFIGRYRVAAHSMLRSVTNISTDEAEALLDSRHPMVRREVASNRSVVRPSRLMSRLERLL